MPAKLTAKADINRIQNLSVSWSQLKLSINRELSHTITSCTIFQWKSMNYILSIFLMKSHQQRKHINFTCLFFNYYYFVFWKMIWRLALKFSIYFLFNTILKHANELCKHCLHLVKNIKAFSLHFKSWAFLQPHLQWQIKEIFVVKKDCLQIHFFL